MARPIRAGSRPGAVLQVGDSLLSRLLGGLGYVHQPADTVEGSPPSLRLTPRLRGEHGSLTIEVRAGTATYEGKIEVAPILSVKGLVVPERPYPPPDRILGVLAIDRGDRAQPHVRKLKQRGATEFVNLGRSFRSLPGTGSLAEYVMSNGPYRGMIMDPEEMRDPVEAAVATVETAAIGYPVVYTGIASRWLLGSDLAHLTRVSPPSDSPIEWLRLAALQKTSAWIDHRGRLKWRYDGGTVRVLVDRRPLPSVSILLSTRRPELIESALGMIARQDYRPIEVRIAIHGGTPKDTERAIAALRNLELDGSADPIPADVPFGEALNELFERSSGAFVTKWDDDDLYGPRHLRDLYAAHTYSGGHLVGKAPEFTYFERGDMMLLRNPYGAETPSTVLAGGTLFAERLAFSEVGGFPPTTRAVDHYLKQEFLLRSMQVFRTHGFGFALVRHSGGHTWKMDEESYGLQADMRWVGVPEVAGL